VAHKVSDLGTLEFLFGGIAFAVAHEEEKANANAGDCDDTDNNTSCDSSHVRTRAATRVVST
jgi:hypothetical protein